MVIPVGENNAQKMLRIQKTTDNEYIYETFSEFKFVPLLSGKNYA
jgi:protein-L-isoaspartate(D-aspartate) O-methyltransferase